MARLPIEPKIAWNTRDKISRLEKKVHKAMANALKPIIFDKNKLLFVQMYKLNRCYFTYCRDDMIFGRQNENRFDVTMHDIKTDKLYWHKYETPEQIWRAIKDRFDYAQAFYSSI